MDTLSMIAFEKDTGLIRAELNSYEAEMEGRGRHTLMDYGLRGEIQTRSTTTYTDRERATRAFNAIVEAFELDVVASREAVSELGSTG